MTWVALFGRHKSNMWRVGRDHAHVLAEPPITLQFQKSRRCLIHVAQSWKGSPSINLIFTHSMEVQTVTTDRGPPTLAKSDVRHTHACVCIYFSGLFKGNPNPPGDCGLDGLRIAGGIPAPVAIRLVTLCGGFSIDHFP
jgi:hypothetical protein